MPGFIKNVQGREVLFKKLEELIEIAKSFAFWII